MSEQSRSRKLHQRLNELLDHILERKTESTTETPAAEFNLGQPNLPLKVSMESFFDFNFGLNSEIKDWSESMELDEHQRHWDEFADVSGRSEPQTDFDDSWWTGAANDQPVWFPRKPR